MSVRPFPAEAGELFTKRGDEWAHTVPAHDVAKTALQGMLPPFGEWRGFVVDKTEVEPDGEKQMPSVHVIFGVRDYFGGGHRDHNRAKPLLSTEWDSLDARTQLILRSMAGEMITEADVFAVTELPNAELHTFVPAQVIELSPADQRAA